MTIPSDSQNLNVNAAQVPYLLFHTSAFALEVRRAAVDEVDIPGVDVGLVDEVLLKVGEGRAGVVMGNA